MKPLAEDSPEGHQISTFVNYACLVLVFGALLAIKIYIHSTGDYSARWLVIQYLPFFLIGGIVWLIACVVSIASWVRNGNSKTHLIARVAALSLPVCAAIVAVT